MGLTTASRRGRTLVTWFRRHWRHLRSMAEMTRLSTSNTWCPPTNHACWINLTHMHTPHSLILQPVYIYTVYISFCIVFVLVTLFIIYSHTCIYPLGTCCIQHSNKIKQLLLMCWKRKARNWTWSPHMAGAPSVLPTVCATTYYLHADQPPSALTIVLHDNIWCLLVERVRNKSTKKNPGSSLDSNPRPSEY